MINMTPISSLLGIQKKEVFKVSFIYGKVFSVQKIKKINGSKRGRGLLRHKHTFLKVANDNPFNINAISLLDYNLSYRNNYNQSHLFDASNTKTTYYFIKCLVKAGKTGRDLYTQLLKRARLTII